MDESFDASFGAAQEQLRSAAEDGGASLELTEDAVALAFAERHRDELRYCHSSGAWYVWVGTHWRQNGDGIAFSWARDLVRRMNREATFRSREMTGKAAFARAVEYYAQRDRAFAVTADVWDPSPFSLGTPGGVVELETGRMRAARQGDMITMQTGVAPAPPGTPCDRWLAFLDDATGRDDDLIRFLQLWCGYCLTGSVQEHALVFLYGPGGNGKSVFLNTVARVLGDYCRAAPMDTFAASHGDRHPADLAMLRGARLVTATETEEGRAWAESRIKQMTGGDPVTARFMRKDFFTYKPQFKLTLAGNHKPGLRNVDEAARRRFNIVPFIRKPTAPDPMLEQHLRDELPAILRWMIDGCIDWQEHGLPRPSAVAAATDEYFEAQDTFGRWMAERCDRGEGLSEAPGQLLRSFLEWAHENGESIADSRRLRGALERTPGCRYVTSRGKQLVRGVALRASRSESGLDGRVEQ